MICWATICTLLLAAWTPVSGTTKHAADKHAGPNFVIILCDDLGYGDVSPFGHPTIRTPQLDRMAQEGQKWTSFYVAAPDLHAQSGRSDDGSVADPQRHVLERSRRPVS